MRIDVKGRNVAITDELEAHVRRRARKIDRQVSELAVLEVELHEHRNPSIADAQVAEALLQLKGVTLRASESAPELRAAITACLDDLGAQVGRHRGKRLARRRAPADDGSGEASPAA